MRTRNRLRIFAIVGLLLISLFLVSCVSSCSDSIQFFAYGVEYDYLLIEFSNDSYAWLEMAGYRDPYGKGQLIYGDNVIVPLSMEYHSAPCRADLNIKGEGLECSFELYCEEGNLECKAAKFKFVGPFNLASEESRQRIDEMLSQILEEGQETVIIYKLSTKDWQRWMQAHSLKEDATVE